MAKSRRLPTTRRVLLGVAVAVAFVLTIWRSWGLDTRTLLEFFTGSILLVLSTMIAAFILVAIIRFIRLMKR